MHELLNATGINRLSVFFRLISLLGEDRGRTQLSLSLPKTDGIQMKRLNSILKFIADNYSRSDLSCREIAERENMGLSAFSRFFERQVRCPCLEYLNRMRIYKSCQMLIETFARSSNRQEWGQHCGGVAAADLREHLDHLAQFKSF